MENDGSAMSKLIQMQRWNLPFFRWPLGQHRGVPMLQESQRQQRKNEILGEPEPAARLGTSPTGDTMGIYWDMEDPKFWSSFLHIFAMILKLGLYERLEWLERTAARTW